jgi:capsular polysaccharide biosynthesis protein
METILYESPDISRNDLSNIYGSQEHVEQFVNRFKYVYRNEHLTVYPKKRVVMTMKKNIVVNGNDPVFYDLTEEQQKIAKYNVPFAAVPLQKWGKEFYHFVNENLPKILRIFEYNPKIPILTFYNDTYIKSILTYAGVTNPIIPYDGKQFYTIKNAILITETASGNPSPKDIDLVRKYIRVDETQQKDVIVLIYRKEYLRSIVNFDSMYEGLKAQFPTEQFVIFDSLPFDKTVQLFQRAKLVIGAHGAGLSNMIFGAKKTPVIEIFPTTVVNVCYWHLSWTLQNPHYILAATPTGNPALQITVNPDELYAVINKALA